MSGGGDDAKATLPEPAATLVAPGGGPAIALTIVFHPDAARVGERAVLGQAEPGVAAQLARNEPSFAPVRGGRAAPLDDPHLSRAAVSLTVTAGGGVRIDASKTTTSVVVRGRPVTTATLEADDVRVGVVLLVANRIVLLLHRVASAPGPHGGEGLGLFGESDGLRAVIAEIHSVADLTKPVLLRGESGSGKELVARAIHQLGPRRDGPFVAVNLGAVPATIAATELFGSERGAFTGAVRRRGYFEQADGGTLFLDEIGEAPVELQAALLRVLQDGEIQPVGGERSRKVDVRVVAATDADLETRIADGSFRAPLLNRLSAYQVWIPPLRERRDDIGRLMMPFFREELREIGQEARLAAAPDGSSWLSPSLVAQLLTYHWPGNVRQLRNVVRHLVIGSRALPRVTLGPATLRLLTDWTSGPDSPAAEPGESPDSATAAAAKGPSLDKAPDSHKAPASGEPKGSASPGPRRKAGEIGEEEMAEALRSCRWEIAAAARKLGIPRPSLHLAMKRFPRFRTAGDVPVSELTEAHRACAGDLAAMADKLEVSERALLRRARELGLAVT